MRLPSGIENLLIILDWFWWVMRCQVQPDIYIASAETCRDEAFIWPTWEWAAWEGIFSTRRTPWHWQAGLANRISRKGEP